MNCSVDPYSSRDSKTVPFCGDINITTSVKKKIPQVNSQLPYN